jgi:hypothetical protein
MGAGFMWMVHSINLVIYDAIPFFFFFSIFSRFQASTGLFLIDSEKFVTLVSFIVTEPSAVGLTQK